MRSSERRHLLDITDRATALMQACGTRFLGQGLLSLGWTFGYDRAVKRLGKTTFRRGRGGVKQITISRSMASSNAWVDVKPVVLHEIAHALDFETRGTSDHGPVWKQWARRLDIPPQRLYTGDLQTRASKWVGVCPRCAREVPFFRKPRRTYACSPCCRTLTGGSFTPAAALIIQLRET